MSLTTCLDSDIELVRISARNSFMKAANFVSIALLMVSPIPSKPFLTSISSCATRDLTEPAADPRSKEPTAEMLWAVSLVSSTPKWARSTASRIFLRSVTASPRLKIRGVVAVVVEPPRYVAVMVFKPRRNRSRSRTRKLKSLDLRPETSRAPQILNGNGGY